MHLVKSFSMTYNAVSSLATKIWICNTAFFCFLGNDSFPKARSNAYQLYNGRKTNYKKRTLLLLLIFFSIFIFQVLPNSFKDIFFFIQKEKRKKRANNIFNIQNSMKIRIEKHFLILVF
ncbi:hypothetical protein PanWU01x14_268750 [Parasponia andersonii]|uniref:Uncharacterized protein n=1 Tax=Parasponia andersonii TaxID=3476 RepID=A0A2P5B5Y1_PARAD|nr:hypothetical protein PanWU01x14_268750 [Parasponia andersonii]